MSAENSYYAPCPEFDRCNELIDRYYKTKQYEPCFIGHLAMAERGSSGRMPGGLLLPGGS